MNTTPFQTQLRANIHDWIKDCIAHGTTGAGMECLIQSVRTPHATLAGAPAGSHARYAYREIFREVCAGDKVIQAFLIP